MRVLVASLLSLVACSTDSGPDSCSCDITYNGVSQTLACGTSDCVNGQTYACSATAAITSGGTCTGSGSGTGSGPGNGSGSGSGGATMFDCYGETCNSASQYCILAKVGTVTSASSCAPLPSGCNMCSCITGVEEAWKMLNNGTNNCTSATLVCAASQGEVTVICQK